MSRAINQSGNPNIIHENLAVCNIIHDIFYYDNNNYNTRNLREILEILRYKLNILTPNIIKKNTSYYENVLYNKIKYYNLEYLVTDIKYNRNFYSDINFSDYGTKDCAILIAINELFKSLNVIQTDNNIAFVSNIIYTNNIFTIDELYDIVKIIKTLIILRSMNYYTVKGYCLIVDQQDKNHALYIYLIKSVLTQMLESLESLANISTDYGINISGYFIINKSCWYYETIYDFSNFVTDTYQDFDVCKIILIDIIDTEIDMNYENFNKYNYNIQEHQQNFNDIQSQLNNLYNYWYLYNYYGWYGYWDNLLNIQRDFVNNRIYHLRYLKQQALNNIEYSLHEKSDVESLEI